MVEISNELEASDDNKLLGGYAFGFNTVNVDIFGNLLAYYTFDGNSLDASGHSLDGNAVNVQFGADING